MNDKSKIEIGGITHGGNQYQIPYDKFEKYLNGIDPKQMKLMSALDIARKCFEFGFMYNSLDLEDYKARVVNLNEQNLKWFNKADEQSRELVKMRLKLAELGVVSLEEPTSVSIPSKESSSENSQLNFLGSESLPKKPEVSEDSQTSTVATKESTSN